MPGVVNHFKCNCSNDYLGRTQCCLRNRIPQHIPGWLQEGGTNRPRSKKTTRQCYCPTPYDLYNRHQDPTSSFEIIEGTVFLPNFI